jgi:general secretion pathway protein N
MRLDQARPVTWLLAAIAGLALLGWLLALAGMGAHVAPADDDPAMLQPLPQLQATPASHLAPLAQYAEAAARPVFAQDRRPHPFALPQGAGDDHAQADAFDYVLSSVLIAPGFQMAIIEPAQGGDSVMVRLGGGADAIPGWRLAGLQPRSAVFEGPGGRRVLELRTWTGEGGAAAASPSVATAGMSMPAPDMPAAPTPSSASPPAPTQVQMQMDAIRKRIEARRAQLRQQAAQPTAPARNP